jgi:anaerobic ribonucleoside-triphosphate reductase
VARFLEENKILNKEYLKDSFHVPHNNPASPLRRLRYEATIQSEVVEAVLIKNIETSEIQLIDAWVRTE